MLTYGGHTFAKIIAETVGQPHIMTMDILERPMAQKKNRPAAASGGAVRPFPPEAYDYDEDVDAKTVAAMREAIGIDFESDEWELVDGFGRVIHAA